ncbi:MAG: Oxygen-independent coproporphyrinogen-III oxidase 1 [Bacteroidetes bacterium]|nr:Oxygen-independent coproporphyrinogen-III oxidase 1 [Bacteroidota bacterium]
MAGIYIHIPFCKTLCSYCDFYHVVSRTDNRAFIDALVKESAIRREYIGNEIISTIYIGGGTPSLLSVKEIQSILDNIRKLYSVEENCEITMEMNPDDIGKDYLNDLKNSDVNRISLGIQSWRDSDLRLLNRRHNVAQAVYALEETIKTGFKNVTIDLIYGIPGLTSQDWSSNLDFSFSFDIKHLSAYHLTIEPGTVFGKMKEKGLLSEIEEEESNTQFHILIDKAESAGFVHYEISNFGKPGFFSMHNSNYWKQVNYLGLGPSAHSFNGYSRQWNVSDVKKYIKAVNSGSLLFEREELDKRTRFNEYIMTSLRTMWGIDLDYVERTFDKEGYDYIVNLAGKFIDYGLMKPDKKTLMLTNQGKMISDNVISELMLPAEK